MNFDLATAARLIKVRAHDLESFARRRIVGYEVGGETRFTRIGLIRFAVTFGLSTRSLSGLSDA